MDEIKYWWVVTNTTTSVDTIFLDAKNNILHTWRNLLNPTSSDPETNEFYFVGKDVVQDTHTTIYIYTALIAALIALTMIRSYWFFVCASNASKNLHAKMFNCLLKTPMRFFDTNPSGRILNRFSKDTGVMDETLPKILSDAIQVSLTKKKTNHSLVPN